MIDNLKHKLGCDNDQSLAKLLGVGRNTIARMKKGDVTKITQSCKVIKSLLDEMTESQRRACIRKLHYGDNNNVSRNNTMFTKKNYEKFSNALKTSGEILYAIEQVAGDDFETISDDEMFGDRIEEIDKNSDAYALWEEGGRYPEILAELPTKNGGFRIEDGTEVFWGMNDKFAEFDGEKWIMAENF